MEWSIDSLEPSSSLATHATYHDYDSMMSSSIASGCTNTLIGSMDDSHELMTTSVYIPEGEFPVDGLKEKFDEGENVTEEETVDASGNIHIQKVVQRRVI